MERAPSPSGSGTGRGEASPGDSGAPGSPVALRRTSTTSTVTRSLASKHSASFHSRSGSRRGESTTSAATSGSGSSARTGSLSRSSGSYSSRRSSEESSTGSSTPATTNSASSSACRSGDIGSNGSAMSTGNRSRSASDASQRSISTIKEEGEDGDSRTAARAESGSGEEQATWGPRPPSPSWSGSEADWGEDKWLAMADHYDAQRRITTTAGWEGRKQKFPELFRSDVSICPSYSQFQVPYWSVCRRRYARSLRRIHRRLAEDVEELALLQTRALDGVRVVRCFSLGVRPLPPPPDPLSAKQRLRVEQILA